MEIIYKNSFEKDLLKCPKPIVEKVGVFVLEIEKANHVTELLGIEKLKGYSNYFKKRIGNYRLGFQFIEPKVILITILKRDERTYKEFPPK